jgi:hypothetical protein
MRSARNSVSYCARRFAVLAAQQLVAQQPVQGTRQRLRVVDPHVQAGLAVDVHAGHARAYDVGRHDGLTQHHRLDGCDAVVAPELFINY